MSVFCQAVVYLLVALPGVAQSQSFATITIKAARLADPRNARVQVLPNGDLIASAVPLIALLSYAYDASVNPSPRLSTLPDWTVREKYDIEAKAPGNAIPPGLQDSEVRSRIQQMIRGLLADRFRLVMRVENKTMSVYALTVASRGPKLQKSPIAEKDCTFDTDPEGFQAESKRQRMSSHRRTDPDAIGNATSQSSPETILSVRRLRPFRNHCIARQEAMLLSIWTL